MPFSSADTQKPKGEANDASLITGKAWKLDEKKQLEEVSLVGVKEGRNDAFESGGINCDVFANDYKHNLGKMVRTHRAKE